ncbi:MAG: hypothetical protein E6H88_03645 [Chloroflexi bacterium]|nr:MAG: hypothetical protein E6H88_03645 [Chloroflexota bacterium]
MNAQPGTWLANLRGRLVVGLVVGLLLANLFLLVGRALADVGDIGGSPTGFHQHLACRLVSPGHAPPPVGERYGEIRVLDLHVGQTPGTTEKDSCDTTVEQYIQIVINHETGAHP